VLPNLPQDGEKVIGLKMTLPSQPKSMIIVGSGAIGVEFAHFYKWGQKSRLLNLPNIVPIEDEDISKQMERSKRGVKIMTNSSVEKIDTGEGEKSICKKQLKEK
jgi:dihydrolipoamide dehydrogenase